MTNTLVEETQGEQNPTGNKKSVGVIGVPLSYGASMAGVDIGPAALRVARLIERIGALGYDVRDLGDLHLERARSYPRHGDTLKYLDPIASA